MQCYAWTEYKFTCVCVSVTLSVNSPTCQTAQRIFTADTLKDAHIRHVIKNENFQNSRWRTAAILKIDTSPYLNEKSSDFYEILYTAANFKLNERHVALVIKWKSCIGQTPTSTERISCLDIICYVSAYAVMAIYFYEHIEIMPRPLATSDIGSQCCQQTGRYMV